MSSSASAAIPSWLATGISMHNDTTPPSHNIYDYGVDESVANASFGPMLIGYIMALLMSLWYLLTLWRRPALHSVTYYTFIGQTLTDGLWCLFNVAQGLRELAAGTGIFQGSCEISGFWTAFVIASNVCNNVLIAYVRRRSLIEVRHGKVIPTTVMDIEDGSHGGIDNEHSSTMTTSWLFRRQLAVTSFCALLVAAQVELTPNLELSPAGRYCWASMVDPKSWLLGLGVLYFAFALITTCYVSIYHHVRASRTDAPTMNDERMRQRIAHEATLACRMFAIVAIFFVSYIPAQLQAWSCGMEIHELCSSAVLDVMTEAPVMAQIIVNPLMLIAMDHKLRDECMHLLAQWCCCYVAPPNGDDVHDIAAAVAARAAWTDNTSSLPDMEPDDGIPLDLQHNNMTVATMAARAATYQTAEIMSSGHMMASYLTIGAPLAMAAAVANATTHHVTSTEPTIPSFIGSYHSPTGHDGNCNGQMNKPSEHMIIMDLPGTVRADDTSPPPPLPLAKSMATLSVPNGTNNEMMISPKNTNRAAAAAASQNTVTIL